MNPLSITSSVVGLTATCVKTAKKLHDLKDKYQNANLTISAICTESTIISASLSRIQSSILDSPNALSDKLNAQPDLEATLDQALTGCYDVFDVLQDEVEKLTESARNSSSDLPFTAKVRYLWNENTMRDIREQLRGLQQALVLLLQVLGAYVNPSPGILYRIQKLTEYRETMVDLKYRMDNNTTMLQQLVHRTSRFSAAKGARPTQSIFDMSVATQSIPYEESVLSATFFSFDDEVVGSHAYRRALIKAFPRLQEKEQGEPTDPEMSAAASRAPESGISAQPGRF